MGDYWRRPEVSSDTMCSRFVKVKGFEPLSTRF